MADTDPGPSSQAPDTSPTAPTSRIAVNGQPYACHPTRGAQFQSKNQSIAERLWARIEVRKSWECWPWTGSSTAGGGRTPVRYGNLNEGTLDGGSHRRSWRAHVAVLILFRMEETLKDVPMDEGEELIAWMRRAKRYYTQIQGLQASHQCDNSLCCNPMHLEWESQSDNLAFQQYRAKQRETDPTWVPRCCQPPEIAG